MRRRWGRRSETYLFGSREGETERFGPLADGTPYDLIFVFDDVGYNFEPSEIGAAYGLVQLDKLDEFNGRRNAQLAAARRLLRRSTRSSSCGRAPPRGAAPRGCATRSCCATTVSTAPRCSSSSTSAAWPRAWCGRATSSASPASPAIEHRQPADGLPGTDRVMDRALSLPIHHGLTSDDMGHMLGALDDLFASLFKTELGHIRGGQSRVCCVSTSLTHVAGHPSHLDW